MPTERARRGPARDGLFIVGLVGRAGAGKSTVAGALAADGAVVIDADRIGHEVTDRDPEVRAALAREYGASVYRADGTLDRPQVAARVFRDAEARARLDQLVHPRIVQVIAGRLERLRAEQFRGVVVLDAALLLDWGMERGCDAVVAVAAREEDQVARLMEQRGWSREEAGRRLAVQRPEAAFRAAADVTLDNTGDPGALRAAARAAVATLRARAAGETPAC